MVSARPRQGFTLVEMLVVGSLTMLIGGVLLEFSMRHMDFLNTTAMQSDLRSQTHLAMEAMLKELHHGTRAAAGSPPNVSIPAAPNNTGMTFYLPADVDGNGMIIDAAGTIEWVTANPVQYVYDAPSQQLRRTDTAGTRVLANSVTAATFEDRTITPTLPTDEVRIRLTLQGTTPRGRTLSASDTAVIQLRN